MLDTNVVTLAGKTAVVTGAAAGIGRAILEVYVAAGAHVIAVDRDGERLKQACWSSALSERTHPVVADVACEDDVRRQRDRCAGRRLGGAPPRDVVFVPLQ